MAFYGNSAQPVNLAAPADENIPSLIDGILSLASELDNAILNIKVALTGEAEPASPENQPITNNVSAQLALIRSRLGSAVCSKNRICQKLAL